MTDMINQGLDQLGYITNPYSTDHIQEEFKPVVAGAMAALQAEFPNKIHSIYLYGSIGRGNAIIGQSDLDMSLVFHSPLTAQDAQQLMTLAIQLNGRFSTVTKIDFDPGHVKEVLDAQETYRWHFWLKHCCCCVWGEDLSVGFAKHKPSVHIAHALNEDLDGFVDRLPAKGLAAPDIANKVVAKKLIRSAYYLIAPQDQSWYTDIHDCVHAAYPYYPAYRHELEWALQLATQGVSTLGTGIELFQAFAPHLIECYQQQLSVNQ